MEKKNIFALLCVVASSFLFYLSFPNIISKYGFWITAFFFGVPLFCAIGERNLRDRMILGSLFGMLSSFLVLNWLFPITVLGAVTFSVILSIQPLLFCSFFAVPVKNRKLRLLYVPVLWVSSEYIRAVLLNGFTWTLGYSQSFNVPAIQLANITGSYGISFILILINYALYCLLKEKDTRVYLISIFTALLFLIGYGYICLGADDDGGAPVKISVVQGNVDRYEEWNDESLGKIMRQYTELTKIAARNTAPDLIIWPETSLPWDYSDDMATRVTVALLSDELDIPLLLGVPFSEDGKYYNSVLLVGPNGALLEQYKKKKLIPFIEYLPLEKYTRSLKNRLNLKTGVFHPGEKDGIFLLDGAGPSKEIRKRYFGVVICSEDFYPGLVRKLVDRKSDFVVNITNDTLRGNIAASYLHAQASIMRAVENRIPVVRCADNGWSCFITGRGEIINSPGGSGKILSGKNYSTSYVTPMSRPTLYTKGGEIFPIFCLALCAGFLFFAGGGKKLKMAIKQFILVMILLMCIHTDAHSAGGAVRKSRKGRGSPNQSTGQGKGQVKGPIKKQKKRLQYFNIDQISPVSGDLSVDLINEEAVDLTNEEKERIINKLGSSSVAWGGLSRETKELMVSRFIEKYRESGVIIAKKPEFYVAQINAMAKQNPGIMSNPFAQLLKVMAVIEYDFGNGQNKDQMARHVLGEKAYVNNKKRLGMQ